ncbi:MAG: hypothetical protein B7Y41_04000 [Hydrogenophilales bacterium 28-61-23]|nr:MAG: hypothetical protein B7Y41_04000 [Hydrogenophilales bacterium 28-61-23]
MLSRQQRTCGKTEEKGYFAVTPDDDFAHRLTSALDQGLREIDAPTGHRLASMRSQAISGDRATLGGIGILAWVHRHIRLASFATLAILLASWWFVQTAPRPYSVETDILLLTGDLPPQAYADKTFSQWLN